MPVINYCLSGPNSFCLLCEDGSGPFKYFPMSAVQCQTWSVGIAEGTLRGKGFAPLLGRLQQYMPTIQFLQLRQCPAPGSCPVPSFPRARLLPSGQWHKCLSPLSGTFVASLTSAWTISLWTVFAGALEKGKLLTAAFQQTPQGSIPVTCLTSSESCAFCNRFQISIPECGDLGGAGEGTGELPRVLFSALWVMILYSLEFSLLLTSERSIAAISYYR